MKKSHPSRSVKQHTAMDIRFCRKERMGKPKARMMCAKTTTIIKQLLRTTGFRENTLIA